MEEEATGRTGEADKRGEGSVAREDRHREDRQDRQVEVDMGSEGEEGGGRKEQRLLQPQGGGR